MKPISPDESQSSADDNQAKSQFASKDSRLRSKMQRVRDNMYDLAVYVGSEVKGAPFQLLKSRDKTEE